MAMGWRDAPRHDEAKHTVGVTRFEYTPHLEHSLALPARCQRSTQTQPTGSPRPPRNTSTGRCGHIPPREQLLFLPGAQGSPETHCQAGKSPGSALTAAAERACQINPTGENRAAHPEPSMSTPNLQSSRPA